MNEYLLLMHDDAQALVAGNPVYEGGGTVESRELPRG